MKAITVKQPWASLIVHGIKDIENRTWTCPKKYIGQRVLIHAGADKRGFWDLNDAQIHELRNSENTLFKQSFNSLPFGSIIGSVEIVGCSINHSSIWAEKTDRYNEKPIYNWTLANPVLFEKPIPAKGKLSFWDYPGVKEVKIECPECGSTELAIEDYTTVPFPTYLHSCNKCGHVVMESEWDVIEEGGKP